MAILGAFLVLERVREFAILETLGAGTRQTLAMPALESGAAVLGSFAFGLPSGLGVGMLTGRLPGVFFALMPPLPTLPWGGLALLAAAAAAFAIPPSLAAVPRICPATILHAP